MVNIVSVMGDDGNGATLKKGFQKTGVDSEYVALSDKVQTWNSSDGIIRFSRGFASSDEKIDSA